ncbi:hypothetical protein [Streptomyces sp. NPDC048636]|uniref:hypothetical protein n=1 Tax=Streptomyces sp. NPDC048636 TaxID=3155762 RepID=UPI0034218C73
MRSRPLATLSAALLTPAALALSLTACGPDSDESAPSKATTSADGHGRGDRERSGGDADSSGSSSGTTTGGSDTNAGGGGSDGGDASDGAGGTADNTRHVALPLPDAVRPKTASGQDDSTLLLQYGVDGSPARAESTLGERFMKSGYEENDGALTRGHQRLFLDSEGGTLNLMIDLPTAKGYLPLPPQAQLTSLRSRADDTLVFSYRRAGDENSSLSTLKTFIPELQNDGWKVPTDGGTHFTKGQQAIDADVTDQNSLELAVHLPSSVD